MRLIEHGERSTTWVVLLAITVTIVGGTLIGYFAVQAFLLPDTLAQQRLNRIPDLSGSDLETARQQAEEEGYVLVSGGERRSAQVEAGAVIYQLPPPGIYRPRGDTVRVLLSRGVEAVQLPDLTGLDPESATAIVNQLGLRTTASRSETSEIIPLGSVVETIPPAGAEVSPDTEVTFVLSGGGSFVTMPSLVGLTVAAARDSIEARDLLVGDVQQIVSEGQFGGTAVVVGQFPAPGGRVRAGSAVRLDVGLRRRS